MERLRRWWLSLLVAVFLCASLALAVLLFAPPALAGDSSRLTFLHVNDVYQISP